MSEYFDIKHLLWAPLSDPVSASDEVLSHSRKALSPHL